MILRPKNDQDVNAQKSFLATAASSAGTSVAVKNINAFTQNWYAQVGATGEEKSEIKQINGAPSGSIVPVGALTYDHPTDTPVYCIKYNQIVFKRSTSGTAGTATAMTDGTVTITPDSQYTIFDDGASVSTYAYKTGYRNSALGSASADSDWITPGGLPMYSLGNIRQRVRDKLPGDSFVTDDQIDDWLNEWLEQMTNVAIDVNEDYALGTTEIAFSGTVQEGTITSDDFKQPRRAWYTQNGTDIYQMTKQEYTGFFPAEEFDETHPYYYMKGDTIIGRNPHDESGTIQLSYYKLNPVLDSDGDNLPWPMRGYSTSFVKYGVAQAKRKDNKEQEASALEGECKQDLEKFKKELTPRQKSGPTYIQLVEDVGGSDYENWYW